MIKMINALTGGDMWVADNRVDEYKAFFPQYKVVEGGEERQDSVPCRAGDLHSRRAGDLHRALA